MIRQKNAGREGGRKRVQEEGPEKEKIEVKKRKRKEKEVREMPGVYI